MSVDLTGGNKNMDYDQHKQTYDFFIGLVKYGTISTIIVVALMALFLT